MKLYFFLLLFIYCYYCNQIVLDITQEMIILEDFNENFLVFSSFLPLNLSSSSLYFNNYSVSIIQIDTIYNDLLFNITENRFSFQFSNFIVEFNNINVYLSFDNNYLLNNIINDDRLQKQDNYIQEINENLFYSYFSYLSDYFLFIHYNTQNILQTRDPLCCETTGIIVSVTKSCTCTGSYSINANSVYITDVKINANDITINAPNRIEIHSSSLKSDEDIIISSQLIGINSSAIFADRDLRMEDISPSSAILIEDSLVKGISSYLLADMLIFLKHSTFSAGTSNITVPNMLSPSIRDLSGIMWEGVHSQIGDLYMNAHSYYTAITIISGVNIHDDYMNNVTIIGNSTTEVGVNIINSDPTATFTFQSDAIIKAYGELGIYSNCNLLFSGLSTNIVVSDSTEGILIHGTIQFENSNVGIDISTVENSITWNTLHCTSSSIDIITNFSSLDLIPVYGIQTDNILGQNCNIDITLLQVYQVINSDYIGIIIYNGDIILQTTDLIINVHTQNRGTSNSIGVLFDSVNSTVSTDSNINMNIELDSDMGTGVILRNTASARMNILVILEPITSTETVIGILFSGSCSYSSSSFNVISTNLQVNDLCTAVDITDVDTHIEFINTTFTINLLGSLIQNTNGFISSSNTIGSLVNITISVTIDGITNINGIIINQNYFTDNVILTSTITTTSDATAISIYNPITCINGLRLFGYMNCSSGCTSVLVENTTINADLLRFASSMNCSHSTCTSTKILNSDLVDTTGILDINCTGYLPVYIFNSTLQYSIIDIIGDTLNCNPCNSGIIFEQSELLGSFTTISGSSSSLNGIEFIEAELDLNANSGCFMDISGNSLSYSDILYTSITSSNIDIQTCSLDISSSINITSPMLYIQGDSISALTIDDTVYAKTLLLNHTGTVLLSNGLLCQNEFIITHSSSNLLCGTFDSYNTTIHSSIFFTCSSDIISNSIEISTIDVLISLIEFSLLGDMIILNGDIGNINEPLFMEINSSDRIIINNLCSTIVSQFSTVLQSNTMDILVPLLSIESLNINLFSNISSSNTVKIWGDSYISKDFIISINDLQLYEGSHFLHAKFENTTTLYSEAGLFSYGQFNELHTTKDSTVFPITDGISNLDINSWFVDDVTFLFFDISTLYAHVNVNKFMSTNSYIILYIGYTVPPLEGYYFLINTDNNEFSNILFQDTMSNNITEYSVISSLGTEFIVSYELQSPFFQDPNDDSLSVHVNSNPTANNDTCNICCDTNDLCICCVDVLDNDTDLDPLDILSASRPSIEPIGFQYNSNGTFCIQTNITESTDYSVVYTAEDNVGGISNKVYAEFSFCINPSPSSSVTSSTSVSPSVSPTISDSSSSTISITASLTSSISISPSPTISNSSTSSISISSSISKSSTSSISISSSISKSSTSSISLSPSISDSSSSTISITKSVTPSVSLSKSTSTTSSMSITSSISLSATASTTTTKSITSSISISPTSSISFSNSMSLTSSISESASRSITSSTSISSSISFSATQSRSLFSSASNTPSVTPSLSVTSSISNSATSSNSVSQTMSISKTSTSSISVSSSNSTTVSPSESSTNSISESSTSSKSFTNSRTISNTKTSSKSSTSTRSISESPTSSISVTNSPSKSKSKSSTVSQSITKTKSSTKSRTQSTSSTKTNSITGTSTESISATNTISKSTTTSSSPTSTRSDSNTMTLSPSTSLSHSSSNTLELPEDPLFISLSPLVSSTPSTSISISKTPTAANDPQFSDCDNCEIGEVDMIFTQQDYLYYYINNDDVNIDLITNTGDSVGNIQLSLDINNGNDITVNAKFISVDSTNTDLGNIIIDITIQNESGNLINDLSEPLTICLEQDNTNDDICLGYYDTNTNEWVCEDSCLERDSNTNSYCGTTDHLTSFALLFNGATEDCNSSDALNTIIIWLSLSTVGLAIILIGIAIIIIEIQYRINSFLEKRSFEAIEDHLDNIKYVR